MIDIIKKSAKILKNNLIFIQPLLLCLLLFMTVGTFFINKNIYFVGKICLAISMLLLTVAFISGWLYINKLGVLSYVEDDTQEVVAKKAIESLKKFFEGIGANFLKTFAAYFVVVIGFVGVAYFASKILVATIGEPKLIYELPKLAQANSQAEILNFVKGISDEDKLIFSAWVIITNTIVFVCNFFATLYLTVINFSEDNFLKSIWTTIKFFFKNILGSVVIIATMFAIYLGLNFVSLLLGTNSFSLVILIILFTIYLNYCVLLIFCFYNDKTENNSNNRTEFIGENEISD